MRFLESWSLACLASVLPGAACSEPVDPAPPDIALITLDTTRADHLGCYGYHRNTSPEIDRFAEGALLFERHIVPMSTTLPSHMSLMTAVYPGEHGVLANIKHGGRPVVAAGTLHLFAEFAREEGLATAAFVSAAPLKQGSGIERGFELFDQPEGRERRAATTTDRALAWLEAQPREAPFFLWVHYFDPHGPLAPPEEWNLFRADDALDEYLEARRFAEVSERPDGRTLVSRNAMDVYDGEIRYMDAQVGRLLAALAERDRWDRTCVVVVGDHGEGLGQHGVAGHGFTWDEQIHAPLIVRVPGTPAGRVEAVVSTVDVLPTVLERCAFPNRERWLAQAFGRDVFSDVEPRPALSTTSSRRLDQGQLVSDALTLERWKYARDAEGVETLYDLELDPHELEAISNGDEAILGRAARLPRPLAGRDRRAERAARGFRLRSPRRRGDRAAPRPRVRRRPAGPGRARRPRRRSTAVSEACRPRGPNRIS